MVLTPYQRRAHGAEPNGEVSIEDFDIGIIETLGAVDPARFPLVIFKGLYQWKIPNVAPPPGQEGIIVVHGNPEDVFVKYRVPTIAVTRDDFDVEFSRYHPGTIEYRAPARGTQEVTVEGAKGYRRYEEKQAAVPHVITYSFTAMARHQSEASSMIMAMKRIYQPNTAVRVKDSVGDYRWYTAETGGAGNLSELLDVASRSGGHSLSVTVHGELDLFEPTKHTAVTQRPVVTLTEIE